MPIPKAHKYTKKKRLSKAKAWIEKYNGKKLYHGYAKHFGVNKLCAILELEMLGIEINPQLKKLELTHLYFCIFIFVSKIL